MATDLFISEFIEGSSNNKALEFFNNTGAAIDLTAGDYKVAYYFNGSLTAGLTISLTGTVADGEVFVLAHGSADAAILAQADQTNSGALYNGDDAIVLLKGSTIIDSIGQVGVDPGSEWGAGLTSTADNTLRRNADIDAGDSDPTNAFDPAAEWTGFAQNTYDGLGAHNAAVVEPAFAISALSATRAEGTGGVTPFTFTVTRTDSELAGSVNWALEGLGGAGQAAAADFAVTSGAVEFAAGQTQATLTVQVAADAVAESNESFSVRIDGPAGPAANGLIQDDDQEITQIAAIQGAAHTSPMVGQTVTTIGMVTGKTSNGFWIQDNTPDADAATSDGVFIFTNSLPPADIVVGKEVRVSGVVTEFFPNSGSSTELSLTEITVGASGSVVLTGNTGSIDASVIGAGGLLPPTGAYDNDAMTSFDPATDGIDFWESLEGMYVELQDAVAVGPSFTNSFNNSEVFVVVDNGAGAGPQTPNGGLIITPDNFHPEKIAVQEDDRLFNNDFRANTGDTLADVRGIVNYDSRSNYEIAVTDAFTVTPGGLQKESATSLAKGDAGHLNIASYNAENLDSLDAPSRFTSVADELVNRLKSPDIIAMQEIQDDNGATNNGVTGSEATLQALITAIEVAGGPTYAYAYVAPANNADGGEPGGNIRQVFLYNPDRVQLASASPTVGGPNDAISATTNNGDVDLSMTVGRIEPTDPAFDNSRKPTAAEFVFNGETIVVVNNHWNSKGGDDPLFGVNQPPVQVTQTQRIAQAEIVANFVEQLHALDPNAKVVVLGDLNDFGFSAPVERMEAAGMTDLTDLLPENERYDYVFDGNSQDLDHIMVSDSLAGGAAFDVLRINAEFWSQTSDHDPLMARLAIEEAVAGVKGAVLVEGTAGVQNFKGTAAAQAFYFEGSDTGRDTINDFGPNDTLITDVKLVDSNNDGIITLGGNRVLDLDGPEANQDQVAIGGIDLKKGLRYLGERDGHFVYAEAAVRPKAAKESTVVDDALVGVNGKNDIFFFDTALGVSLGDDTITNFEAGDRLVSTTSLGEDVRDLANGLGSLHIFDTAGTELTDLDFDGAMTNAGVTYFIYSLVGGAASTALTF